MDIRKLITAGGGPGLTGPLLARLDEMEAALLDMCSGAGELEAGLRRTVSAGGKRLRPLLAGVCFSAAGGKGEILPLMCMLEAMHTASLIHDDFVDNARLRRGAVTISAASGGLAALRSGDFLLGRAMELLETYRGTGINEALSRTAQEMCLGELEQRQSLYRLDKPGYYRRIWRKTAILIAQSCRCGAAAAGGDPRTLVMLFHFGCHLGMAFQLRDDLLDWQPCSERGKAPLADLRCGIMTLPLILAAEKLPGLEELISSGAAEDLLPAVQGCGALEETGEEIRAQLGRAVSALDGLEACPEKSALVLLCKNIAEVKNNAKN